MKSLYFKVLLWFLAMLAVTAAGLLWVTQLYMPNAEARARSPVAAQLRRARQAYESGGAASLDSYFETLEEVAGLHAWLVDAAGKDLRTGADLSHLLRETKRRGVLPSAPVLHEGRPVVGVPSGDGQYWFFSNAPPGGGPGGPGGPGGRRPPFFVPAHLMVLGSAGALSFWLAYYVTAPVRNLRRVVDGFGAGNLAQRAESGRGDEVGQLAASFNRMADRIQLLVDSQRRLLMDLSHELRSPLTRLGLAVELAKSGSQGDIEPALDRIQREADRLNSLVGGLLQVTRGEADPGAIRLAPLDLTDLVDEIADDARLDAGAKRCEIRVEAPDAPVRVNGDAELLRRAVENVLRNAVRHTPEGSLVEVALSRSGSNARVVIRDQGPGVPDEALPHLCEAFYRVEPTGGFGLGLSIAQRAMQIHKGQIRAENAVPGLRVTLELPATS